MALLPSNISFSRQILPIIAIVGIIAIEAGLLTPPFGLLVYTVKAAIRDDTIGVQKIFYSSVPYWFVMLFAILLIILFPGIANWLPNLLM